ncbi:MAG: P1 family peptidase [Clostridiales bacterium]|nr:P1 family peptidase [Clostridiales bacterium]
MGEGTITDVPGILVGQVTDLQHWTGVTAVIAPEGAVGGVSVRGSAPATRETNALDPLGLVEKVHGVVLSGGSAFGLDAASGVMAYLEEQGIGLETGYAKVPIVAAASLYDLGFGSSHVRPDKAMGYEAARRMGAMKPEEQGNVGAGTGATVGKIYGPSSAMKGGLGTASRRFADGLVVGAVVAVNAVGEVARPGEPPLAGVRDGDRILWLRQMAKERDIREFRSAPGTATTIGVVATNARLNKVQATKVAQMAHGGLWNTIFPTHTLWDGDALFVLATGEVEASSDWVGSLAAEVVAEAIVHAVLYAQGALGIPSAKDMGRA